MPSLCPINKSSYQHMWGSGGIAQHIPNLVTRCEYVVSQYNAAETATICTYYMVWWNPEPG